jgi:AraC family transcriptional activator of pobA
VAAPTSTAHRAGDLALDRLPGAGASLQVATFDGASYGAGTDRGPRRPHRHDYHELLWTRRGTGHHLIDGDVFPVEANTVTLIGRGQVHVFERATGLDGAVVRFGDELLHADPAARANPAWLLGSRGARTVTVPVGDRARLDGLVDTLAAECRRPADSRTIDLQRHFVSGLLLWVERWYEATRTQQRESDDAELQLYRRFSDVLERDFARHHDTAHYAEQLRVAQSVLSRALTHVTGRGTKDLITERRMLEAARLLRFTDLTVGEVAFRAGFTDQLYFSRAFKRRSGEAPIAYRARVRGRDPAATPA